MVCSADPDTYPLGRMPIRAAGTDICRESVITWISIANMRAGEQLGSLYSSTPKEILIVLIVLARSDLDICHPRLKP